MYGNTEIKCRLAFAIVNTTSCIDRVQLGRVEARVTRGQLRLKKLDDKELQ